ncbi:hypothetical protein PHYSODRAFT_335394 [Phytophthora sojae]|uniref:Uncharacterized protein n=1 Tax=Phytophthora sojae (strain P6497) TaxID=1094619 RepID=G4ZV22_PHYSP|nr:hypothetical protein PHYSODRAFT_335394 [Phytophthora sojae]EGZ13646.1 hypothetical protein PHYSODRAFT_335394 [Phytophthora sojae]|eukprot:XP_009531075.1 hypothetical protein PHYSODRAFT_335394 [Phytophthora sojae]
MPGRLVDISSELDSDTLAAGTDAIVEHNASGSRTQVAAGSSGSSAASDIGSRVSDTMEVTVALEDAVRGVSADMDTDADAMVAGDSGSKHNGGRSAAVCAVNSMVSEASAATVAVLDVIGGVSTGTEVGKDVTGDQTAGASSTVSGINSMTSFVEIVSVREEIGGNFVSMESDAMVAGDSGSEGSGRGSAVSSMTSDVVVANVAVLDVV